MRESPDRRRVERGLRKGWWRIEILEYIITRPSSIKKARGKQAWKVARSSQYASRITLLLCQPLNRVPVASNLAGHEPLGSRRRFVIVLSEVAGCSTQLHRSHFSIVQMVVDTQFFLPLAETEKKIDFVYLRKEVTHGKAMAKLEDLK